MDTFTVFNQKQAGASTHALVIGIGYYPHLIGGDKRLFENCEGMKQLTSPPHSARKIAEWLIQHFANPAKELSTVSLLISENEPQQFQAARMAQPVVPKPATMANVKKAVKQWKARGDKNQDNLLLFFFCGHGIAQGIDVALLMQDFGKDPDSPLSTAVNFPDLHRGMDQCTASQQCYFIDACRSSSSTLIEASNYSGEPIIPGRAVKTRYNLPPREAPIFYSTLEGEAAYGRVGRETIFTEILLKSFNACGSDNNYEDESWRVSTTNLKLAIDTLLKEQAESKQYAPTSSLTTFDLHYLAAPPQIPVTVRCTPPEKIKQSAFTYSKDGHVMASRPPASEVWKTDILVGRYCFSAQFPETVWQKDLIEIRPPSRTINLEGKK